MRRDGFFVIRELGGHGIGRTIPEDPRVPNFPHPSAKQALTAGLVITVEPSLRPEPVMPCLDTTAGPCAPGTAAPRLIMSTQL